MARIAKIGLSADVRGFKKQMDEAKKSLEAIGNANISGGAEKKIAALFSNQLKREAAAIQGKIEDITSKIENLNTSSKRAFNVQRVQELGNNLEILKRKYKAIADIQKDLEKGKLPTAPTETPAATGGGGISSIMRGGMGAFGKALGVVGVGMGVSSILNRRERMADERLRIRPLTRDNQLGGEISRLGYAPSERRETQFQIATQTQVTGEALTKLTDMAEQLERGYGVTRGETAGAIGVARRAGIEDQGKFVASTIGTAVASRLEGSKIGEYLQSMTGFMESMSEGVNIDAGSLNGFAGALAGMPFFKNDPSRIFAAIRSMDAAFKSEDRFNQAQAARAIMRAPGAMGAAPAAVEMRRQMGLFGTLDRETLSNLKKSGFGKESLAALGATGGEVTKNMFKDVMETTEGMSPENRAYAFGERLGLDPAAALSIFGKMGAAKAEGKDTDKFFEEMADQIKEATTDPQKLLADRMKQLDKTFANSDGSVKVLSSKIERLGEIITQNLSGAIVQLANSLEKMVSQLGGGSDAIETMGNIGTAGAAGLGAVAVGKMVGGVGKAVGKGGGAAIGKAAEITGAKAGAKAAGRGLAGIATKIAPKTMGKAAGIAGKTAKALKAIPGLGTLISAGFTMKDIYDIVGKYSKGEDITNKDIAILSADVASMIPFIGTGAALGSAGLELLPDNALGTFMKGKGGGKTGAPPVPETGMIGGATPTDMMPIQPGAGGATSTGAMTPEAGMGQVIQFPTGAVLDNTSALRDLTAAIKGVSFGGGGGAAGGSRFPANSTKINRSGVATGK